MCALACAALGAASAEAATPDLRLTILTNSQRATLEKGSFRVRVTSRRAATVRLFATLRTREKGSSAVVSTRVKSVRARRGRSRVVALRLSKAGVRELRGCAKRKLTVQGARVGRSGRAPRRA
ncbi:MAG: hypothetical protein M3340_16125, partial [Actinomycetota bacterium]|nr:hypothetical protein [Actinomycetota bacterium]